MEEKIKIYIPDTVNNILLKDMERFEFYKKDRSFNKNEFYNTLIMNYYIQYQEKNSDFYDQIKKTINNSINSSDFAVNNIASKILEYVNLKANNLDEQKSEVTLSIKPTKKTSDIFDFIENYCLGNSTLSSYFRNLFASYTLLPQDKRERIIFKQIFELLEEAIKTNRKIYFTTSSNNSAHIASPYALSNSKEELFNYLIAEYNDSPYSFRVGRLRKIVILNNPRSFKENNIEIFNKMIKYGPQFAYDNRKTYGEIQVSLTERGKQMYQSMYLHRPSYSKIENDIYYFDCSNEQAFQYFSRFGHNALVIKPEDLKDKLRKFYSMANTTYK